MASRTPPPLPIIADEFLQRLPDIRRAAGAYDGINIKLMKAQACTKPIRWLFWHAH